MPGANEKYPWDEFDSLAYFNHNYLTLRDDDREILRLVRDFFATLDPELPRSGIDVGAGPNLYPTLTMLPLCADITLWERSASNVRWQAGQLPDYPGSWDQFWQVLAERAPYRDLDDPRGAVAKQVSVRQGDIFALPARQWDLGTMFFVAESLTGDLLEFERAVAAFLGALRPGSPFAMAFMAHSLGYDVGREHFPAVSIGEADVLRCLAGRVDPSTEVYPIEAEPTLRTGYDGMILALGRVSD